MILSWYYLTAEVTVYKELLKYVWYVIVDKYQWGEGNKRIFNTLAVPWTTVKTIINKWDKKKTYRGCQEAHDNITGTTGVIVILSGVCRLYIQCILYILYNTLRSVGGSYLQI